MYLQYYTDMVSINFVLFDLIFWFYWMFYDHFSVRSLLAKLDDDEDEVGLKEKPEDTRYIKKITSK